MKRSYIAGTVAALAFAGSAHAQTSDTGNVGVIANVAGLCILGEPSRASIDLGQMANLSGTRVGRIASLPGQTVTLPGSFCNFAGTKVSIRAEALVGSDTSTLQTGFARAVNYHSTVSNWATTPPHVTTAAAANGSSPVAEGEGGSQPAPKVADLTLTLDTFTVPSDAILVAGNYTGRVTITLGPAIGAQQSSGD